MFQRQRFHSSILCIFNVLTRCNRNLTWGINHELHETCDWNITKPPLKRKYHQMCLEKLFTASRLPHGSSLFVVWLRCLDGDYCRFRSGALSLWDIHITLPVEPRGFLSRSPSVNHVAAVETLNLFPSLRLSAVNSVWNHCRSPPLRLPPLYHIQRQVRDHSIISDTWESNVLKEGI